MKPSIHSSKLRKFFTKAGKILVLVIKIYIIFCLAFVVIYPILYMLSVALRQPSDVLDPGVIWVPKVFTLDNFSAVYELLDFKRVFTNSVIITLSSTLAQLVTCSLAGYGLARFKFRLRSVVMAMVITTVLVPVQMLTIPLFGQIRFFDFFGIGSFWGLFTGNALTINLYNSIWSILLPAIFANGIRGAMYIFIFRQFFLSLPKDLEDAAYIDGCGPFKAFTRIIIPCASSPFLVVFLLSIIWYWNDVLFTALFYPKSTNLALAVDTLKAKLALEYDIFQIFQFEQAACVFLILPVLILYLFLQKYFIQSIDRTGLK